jgi:hypothetical protein
MLTGFWPVYGVGVFGAAMAELFVHWTRRENPLPLSWQYWLVTALMIVFGGGIPVLYGIENVSAPVVFQLGASAPLVISNIGKSKPENKDDPKSS